jgi:uncharacterized membrane protein YraQ (UPF0718 family)
VAVIAVVAKELLLVGNFLALRSVWPLMRLILLFFFLVCEF